MTTMPTRDVAAFIGSGSIAGLTYVAPPGTGGNVFYGPERAALPPHVPENAVFVSGGAGLTPGQVMSLRYEDRYPMVHIRTRARTVTQAETWARAIQDLLTGPNGLPSGYKHIQALQSEPTPAFEGTSQLIRFTMTFQLIYVHDALAS